MKNMGITILVSKDKGRTWKPSGKTAKTTLGARGLVLELSAERRFKGAQFMVGKIVS